MAEQAPPVAPRDALDRLMAGNRRFVEGRSDHPAVGLPQERTTAALVNEHRPIAAILACADARLPVSRVFDQGIGDLFVVRVAGNVCGPKMTGSLEFGTAVLGAPLLLVMGHTDCGAVKAAIQADEGGRPAPGHVGAILELIAPAVRAERASGAPGRLADRVVRANAFHSVGRLLQHSDLIADRVREGRLLVVAAVYDLASGVVELMGEHPEQADLLG